MIVALIQGCASTATSVQTAKSSALSKPTYYIYLAGPEVFLPDPIDAGVAKKTTIARLNKENNWPFTLVGLYPMDNEIEDFAADFKTGIKIYHANIELMDKADFVTANMVRFRGPSMDVGTAFEMGYMTGLKKPVFAYYDAKPFYGSDEKPGLYTDRIAKYYPLSKEKPGFDVHGQSIENFKMEDNLMMIGSLETGENKISKNFESAILKIAEMIKNR
jgi:nucleoside 2-deoxyribosyltransferase